jgi:hypothetical protein
VCLTDKQEVGHAAMQIGDGSCTDFISLKAWSHTTPGRLPIGDEGEIGRFVLRRNMTPMSLPLRPTYLTEVCWLLC